MKIPKDRMRKEKRIMKGSWEKKTRIWHPHTTISGLETRTTTFERYSFGVN